LFALLIRRSNIPLFGLASAVGQRWTGKTTHFNNKLNLASGSPVILLRGFVVQIAVEKPNQFRCPCCGYKTLKVPAAMALCPVCWWEDDGQEDPDAAEVRLTVNGQLSLNQARSYYRQCGAAHPRFSPYVRPPQVYEQ